MTRKARPVIGARLSGLVAGVDALAQPAATTLAVGQLRPGTFQPRLHFSEQSLADLTASIQEQGCCSRCWCARWAAATKLWRGNAAGGRRSRPAWARCRC
ncbi:hypothetical protein [Deinococcus multiflagellatus]|uniref:ParB-like N-terminal domain-containing protein n=1 Tax=Deinococcus multiflagellatus TaxID=1656887 RepID=A0ABW1ZSF9_9DEIO